MTKLVIGAHEALPADLTGFQPLPDCRQILQRLGTVASFDASLTPHIYRRSCLAKTSPID
jgi:hypothetical protein